MIDVRVISNEDGVDVQFRNIGGTVGELLEEIACINGALVANMILNGIPEGYREKDYVAFLTQELNKRTKKAIKDVLDRKDVTIGDVEVAEVTEETKKTVKDILKRFEDGTSNGKLN